MRIHDTKLSYEIEYQLVLIQENVYNVCRVSLMVKTECKK